MSVSKIAVFIPWSDELYNAVLSDADQLDIEGQCNTHEGSCRCHLTPHDADIAHDCSCGGQWLSEPFRPVRWPGDTP